MTRDDLLAQLAAVLGRRDDVRFAVLFGSAASGPTERARDIDVALAFRRPLPLLDLAALALDLERACGRPVDVIDLDAATTLLRSEVARHGALAFAPDRDAWVEFQARIPFEMDDLRPHLERQAAGLRRALATGGR